MKKALQKEQGFTLIEVLASIIILTIMFSVLSSFFVNSASYSNSFDKNITSQQLSKSLLEAYQAEGFIEAKRKINTGENLAPDVIKQKLALHEDAFSLNGYSANVSFREPSQANLRGKLVEISVTVTNRDGISSSSTLEGYVRK
ncbi:type II secretion system protein J [Metabacillus indicus]|uniref:PulJ/GspJ family protein n=1 Tax=Metabacillus indicus TaxID=246786 RepID=UPI003983EFB8